MTRFCPLIQLKLQVWNKPVTMAAHRDQILQKAQTVKRGFHMQYNWTYVTDGVSTLYIDRSSKRLSLVATKNRQLITVWAFGMQIIWELPIPVIHKMTWTRILGRNRIKFNEREHWFSRMWLRVAWEQVSMPRRRAMPPSWGSKKCNTITFFINIWLYSCLILWFVYFYCKSLCILVVYVFLLFVHVFLTFSMYSYCCLCILIVRPCILIYVYLLLSMYS